MLGTCSYTLPNSNWKMNVFYTWCMLAWEVKLFILNIFGGLGTSNMSTNWFKFLALLSIRLVIVVKMFLVRINILFPSSFLWHNRFDGFICCDAPNSAPDGVSSEGVTRRDCVELGLFNLYLPFSQIKKKHLQLHYKYHRSGIHVLYTESPYFSIYKTYTYSKNTEIAEAVR